MRTSRPRSHLLAGASMLGLALVLFGAALFLAEYPQSGQGPFQARSTMLLVPAFLLLAGLCGALLFRPASAARSAPRPAQAPAGATAAPEGQALCGEASDEAAGIISEAAGELRSAVNVIRDEIEEILEDEAPADREHLLSLHDETDRLKKIIESMEQLSRAQEIGRRNRQEQLAVEPLLNAIVDSTRLAVPDREIAFSVECEPGLSLQGDPEVLDRIIGNLADNAARAIRGSGTVTLGARKEDRAVVFTVRDTGVGIRRAHLSHIYERFFRGTGTGIGMGLSIVKELVDAAGGKIDVETAVNKGTTFTVRLPLEP